MSDTHATETLQPCVAVTGANRNIGAHLAARFLDEGFGVVAHYRSETAAIERLAARGAWCGPSLAGWECVVGSWRLAFQC